MKEPRLKTSRFAPHRSLSPSFDQPQKKVALNKCWCFRFAQNWSSQREISSCLYRMSETLDKLRQLKGRTCDYVYPQMDFSSFLDSNHKYVDVIIIHILKDRIMTVWWIFWLTKKPWDFMSWTVSLMSQLRQSPNKPWHLGNYGNHASYTICIPR